MPHKPEEWLEEFDGDLIALANSVLDHLEYYVNPGDILPEHSRNRDLQELIAVFTAMRMDGLRSAP